MRLKVEPGKYVIAVSGGVDSIVLLDVLARQPGLELVVAHFDHGIRPDSANDAAFVSAQAGRYGLPFVTERVELGAQASEAVARFARYDFLNRVKEQHKARSIITAHHQDDVLETAVFNLMRGTGRRGLTSLQSTEEIVRPLLHMPKSELKAYALKNQLSWREDSTNQDERYSRNYIRRRLLANLDANKRQQLLALIDKQKVTNMEIDDILNKELVGGDVLPRRWFTNLPHAVAKETLASWLRQQGITDFDRKTLERLTIQIKTKPVGKLLDVLHGRQLRLTADSLALETQER